jgi:hypothetical protein
MTRLWALLLVFVPALAAADGLRAARSDDVWLSPALAGASLDSAFGSPFQVRLEGGGSASVADCAELVALDERITEEGSGSNAGAKAFQASRVHCQAINAVKAMQPALRSRLPVQGQKGRLAAALAQAAPAALYLAISEDSQREVARAGTATLRQFRPAATFHQTAADAARVEVDGTVQDVQLLARGDFNADGFEDWLLRVDSRLTEGSYGTSGLWLVTRVRANRLVWQVLKRWP